MKLAIVHDWLTGMRGGEKCLDVLCRRFPDAQLFTLLHVPGSTSPAIEQMQIHTSFLQSLPGVGRHYRYLLPLMPAAVSRLKLPENIDLVVSFSHAVAKSVIPPAGVPHICFCFTPMRYAWDLRAEYFPADGRDAPPSVWHGRVPGPLNLARNLVLDRLQAWDRATASRVTHFIAISQTVADRISRCYDRPSRVIYPPIDSHFYTPDSGPRDDYYLCVSAMAPYKRLDLAIEACQRLKRPLVIIGRGPQQRSLEQAAGPNVTFLGWRSNEEIRQHLRRCRALLFPGEEDFGIVPLEAQACAAPVIALARGGALETLLPATAHCLGTGVFFERADAKSLSDAMLWLEDNPHRLCPRLARQQAERFATEHYERELISYLEETLCTARG